VARPVDDTPLRDAVVAALTTATGKPDSLGLNVPPSLGKHTLFVEAPSTEPPIGDVTGGPRVTVEIHAHMPNPSSPLEGGDVRSEALTVEVVCWYSSGNPAFKSEIDRQRRIIARDKQRVIKALTCAGVLGFDPSGNDTGADGGCLRWDGYTSRGPVFPKKSDDLRVVSVTHAFRTTVELAT
jgi:hypothetical protein